MSSHAVSSVRPNFQAQAGSQVSSQISSQADRPGSNHPQGSRFATTAAKGGRFVFEAIGLGAITGLVVINPAVVGHLASALAKVGGAIKQAGGFIAANASAFSLSAVLVGVANLGDGLLSVYRGTGALQKLNDAENALPKELRGGEAYKTLRAAHRKTVLRGGLQAIVGATGATIGALVTAGFISNPYGLGAAVAVGVAVLLGVQVHKVLANRKQAQLAKAYQASVTELPANPGGQEGGDDSSAFDSQGAFGSPMAVASTSA